jgi:hypothetical protein
MSWKASLLGAVPVVIAGLATGMAIGGKTTTRLDTATVVHTATVVRTVTVPTSTGPGTKPGNPTTSESPGTGSNEEYLAGYLESQGGAETLNHNAENASMDTSPAQRELAGQTYQHAVAFDLGAPNEGETASYQLPIPRGVTRLTSDAVGLQMSSNASTAFHLAVYLNDASSPHAVVLYRADYRGPSTVHKMSFTTQGATDIVFLWSHSATEPEQQSTFVLADPVLTR